MDTKKCNDCGVEKIITQDFPKNGRIYRAICKVCHCEKQKQRYQADISKHLLKNKEKYQKNKDAILENNKQYRSECAQKKQYYNANRDEILQKSKSKDYKEKRNKYLRDRRQTDKKFALVCAYRARLSEVLQKQKRNTHITYLNCKREMLLDWIEFQFGDKFQWETYGKEWVIDHVMPIDFFDIEDKEHVYKCFSWFNLRPCDIRQNSEKSNKLMEDVVYKHQQVINNFLEIDTRYQADVEIYQWLREKLRYGKKPSVLGDSQPSFQV